MAYLCQRVIYPELYAVVGANIPDYRGVFLRDYGFRVSSHYGTVTHNSGNINQIQGDATREISGGFHLWGYPVQVKPDGVTPSMWGAFDAYRPNYTKDKGSVMYAGGPGYEGVHFYSSRVTPVANENRPINVAVRYLILASD